MILKNKMPRNIYAFVNNLNPDSYEVTRYISINQTNSHLHLARHRLIKSLAFFGSPLRFVSKLYNTRSIYKLMKHAS